MHIWLVESSMATGLHKANFSLLQRNKFYLTIMVVETLRRYNPNSIPNESNYLPNNINYE